MNLGIVMSTNEAEEIWNAFRLGNVALKENHTVKVFLVNKGVEAEDIKSERFPVAEQLPHLSRTKGKYWHVAPALRQGRKKEPTFAPFQLWQTC
ncbi:MAG TPA: sulfur reduction protein DsrE [Candidatus Bathyarchaeia archaeon]|nr:sulfur reduction protein DsrE [Candidatus Bathyarchaeia archaeon]